MMISQNLSDAVVLINNIIRYKKSILSSKYIKYLVIFYEIILSLNFAETKHSMILGMASNTSEQYIILLKSKKN
jgi:hypothetical protein